MALETKYNQLIDELFESDEASALTNQAARALEELINEMIQVNATLEAMIDDVDAMNRIGARIYSDRIRNLLQLRETVE